MSWGLLRERCRGTLPVSESLGRLPLGDFRSASEYTVGFVRLNLLLEPEIGIFVYLILFCNYIKYPHGLEGRSTARGCSKTPAFTCDSSNALPSFPGAAV